MDIDIKELENTLDSLYSNIKNGNEAGAIKIKEYIKEGNVIIDGLYSWDELKILKDELGSSLSVIAIVADKKLRYERLSVRDVRPLTKEEAINRDIAEIENIAKAGPIAYADYYIDNNHDLDSYRKRLMEILEEIDEER